MAGITPVLSVRSSSFFVLGRSGIEYVRTVRLTDDFLASSVLKWEINANLSSIVMESNSSHSNCQFANGSSSLGDMISTFTCSYYSGF